MKRHIAVISFFLIVKLVFTQNSFFVKFGTINEDFSGPICELNNSYYFGVTEYIENHLHSSLYKISGEGEVLAQKTFYTDDNSFLIQQLSPIGDTNIIVFSTHSYAPGDSIYLNISCLDAELNTIWEKEHKLDVLDYMIESFLKNTNEQYILAGECYDYNSNGGDPYLVSLHSNGDLLMTQRKYFSGYDRVYDIAKKHQGTNEYYYITLTNISGPLGSIDYIFQMDSAFNTVNYYYVPGDMFLYCNLEEFNDSLFLIAGKYHYPNSSPRDDDIKIVLCNSEFQMINSVLVGAADTVDYPGIQKYLDKTMDSNWFVGGTCNINPNYFPSTPSYIALFKISNNLVELWRKYIGGDAYYMLYNISATTDGGCLLGGTRYDWTTQNNERDAVLIKVDENGLITSTGPGPAIQAHDAIVYPNPGRDFLTIESGPQIAGALFVLYDLAGKPLIEKTLNQTSESLSTAYLPSGLYLWNIIFKGKNIENGKWVKE